MFQLNFPFMEHSLSTTISRWYFLNVRDIMYLHKCLVLMLTFFLHFSSALLLQTNPQVAITIKLSSHKKNKTFFLLREAHLATWPHIYSTSIKKVFHVRRAHRRKKNTDIILLPAVVVYIFSPLNSCSQSTALEKEKNAYPRERKKRRRWETRTIMFYNRNYFPSRGWRWQLDCFRWYYIQDLSGDGHARHFFSSPASSSFFPGEVERKNFLWK